MLLPHFLFPLFSFLYLPGSMFHSFSNVYFSLLFHYFPLELPCTINYPIKAMWLFHNMGPLNHPTLSVSRAGENANTVGQVKLTIGYSTEESRLFIIVHSCRSQTPFQFSIFTSNLAILSPLSFCPCDHFPPSEPWQPAPRTARTLTSPSSCCPTRRAPPRGGRPPRRGTSTRSLTRGKKRQKRQPGGGGGVVAI